MEQILIQMSSEALKCLTENILPFWMEKMRDKEHGGWYGRMDGHGKLWPQAEKGAILNARILWSFSAAYRVLKQAGLGACDSACERYLSAATLAKDYFLSYFLDNEHGGVYWSVDYEGKPLETKKQTYAIGFAIYGLSEYARATDDEEALQVAIRLFEEIELHAFDPVNVGYVEAMTQDWKPIADMRLSDKDENGSRTMNTHLHVLESYTNLLRLFPSEKLAAATKRLVAIFIHRLLNPVTHHLDLFFDDQWHGRRDKESYGHDIEAAWLITEALDVLGDKELKTQTMPVVRQIVLASEEGLLPSGDMIHEGDDRDLHWWVQCENVVGQLNHFQHYGERSALNKAFATFRFIQEHFIDNELGEWFWSLRSDGSINRDDDHAGFWKCPYHNSRMCLEIIERCKLLLK